MNGYYPYPDGGLTVDGDPGLAASQTQSIHTTWDSYDQVSAVLAQMGFPPVQGPPFPRPVLSEQDYVHIEGDDYARTSFKVTKWLEYASIRAAEMRGRLLGVANELSDLTVEHINSLRQAYKNSQEKKPSEAELKERVKLLQRYKELKQAEMNLTIVIDRLEIEVETFTKYGQGLSRQLTMRGQDIELGGKGGRYIREGRG